MKNDHTATRGRYLRFRDIKNSGPVRKTVDYATRQSNYNKTGVEDVLLFTDGDKLPLNMTRIIDLKQCFHAKDLMEMAGQDIEIVAGEVPKYGGKTLRIRRPQTTDPEETAAKKVARESGEYRRRGLEGKRLANVTQTTIAGITQPSRKP